jgi:hypothetical protein
MRKLDVFGHIVRELRSRRRDGAIGAELVAYLYSLELDEGQVGWYMQAAFSLDLAMGMSLACGKPLARDQTFESMEEMLSFEIDANRPSWENRRYPEVMRIRDVVAFMEVAAAHQIRIFVCGANPKSAKYVGRPGFRPWPHVRRAPSTSHGPHAGLMRGDDHHEELAALGLRVDGAGLIRDPDGNAFHESYRLHGVHDARSTRNVWRGTFAERLRSELNRRFGAELIQLGPYDVWEHRDRNEASMLVAQLPLMIIGSDQRIDYVLEHGQLRTKYGRELWARCFSSEWASAER